MKFNVKGPTASSRRIYVIDGHPAFRKGLVEVLESERELRVCGEAGSAEEAFDPIIQLKPDLVLIDITLAGEGGLALIRKLRRADRNMKLLVVSVHDEALYAARVLGAGGNGYVIKGEGPDEITQAVQDVLSGFVYVSESVVRRGRGQPAKGRKRRRRGQGELV